MTPPNASCFATNATGLTKETRDTQLSAILVIGVMILLGSSLWFTLERFVPSIALHGVGAKIEKLWHRIKDSICRLLAAILFLVLIGFLLVAYIMLMLLAVIVAVELG